MEKILLDTNIIIYREDHKVVDKEVSQLLAMLFDSEGYKIVVHPMSTDDLRRSKDEKEKAIILSKIGAYPQIKSPPIADDSFHAKVGCNNTPNDIIDNNLLFAVCRNCVSFLVTNDDGLRKKAKKIGQSDRVLNIKEAIQKFAVSEEPEVYTPVAIKSVPLHNIDLEQRFFDSLRSAYYGFDDWYNRKALDNESAYCHIDNDGNVGAFLMIKKEDEKEEYEDFKKPLSPMPRLKVSTMKVSSNGKYIGEVFIDIIFKEAKKMGLSEIYATVFPEQELLINLFEEYGFEEYTTKETKDGFGEIKEEKVYLKAFKNGVFPNINWDANAFIVPIVPEFHRMIFPEAEKLYQLDYKDLQGDNAYSNTIKKAYFTNSNTKQIKPEDVLYFYASHDKQAITVIGTVDAVFSDFQSVEEAAYVASKRTVYTEEEIKKFLGPKTKLILFKVNSVLKKDIPRHKLISNGIIKDAPQSISRVDSKALQKLIMESGKGANNV